MDGAGFVSRERSHPSTTGQQSVYQIPPPDDPPPAYAPPSYEDATRSDTAPLLVGPSVDYGTYRAFPETDASSIASSEIEVSSRTLPEWIGQLFVILCFLGIIYGFWRFITDTDGNGFPG